MRVRQTATERIEPRDRLGMSITSLGVPITVFVSTPGGRSSGTSGIPFKLRPLSRFRA